MITQNRFRVVPKYSIIREFGPDHDKVFQVGLAVGDIVSTAGLGRNKKEAELGTKEGAFRAREQTIAAREGEHHFLRVAAGHGEWTGREHDPAVSLSGHKAVDPTPSTSPGRR
jgi:hypothetical protein